MIVFQRLRYRNFLSTGNYWSEVDLTSHTSTLVVGANGAGKSTMLDALAFALFGKPHRNINKPQLINSINKKDCKVEVEFTVAGHNYKVIRGLKPNVFEIWKGDVMINQSSHSKEYQKILEQNILKLNHKSFHQIVVLGSSSFIPFMQLSAQHRRDVIEDLLDINIFSKMNLILKEKTSLLKDQIKDVEYKIELEKNKIETQQKYIADIKRMNKDLEAQKHQAIADRREQIRVINLSNEDLNLKIGHQIAIHPNEQRKLESKKQQLSQYDGQFNSEIKSVVKDAKFFKENDTCPTCTQQISAEIKKSKLDAATARAKELNEALGKLKQQMEETNQALERTYQRIEEIRGWQGELATNNQMIMRIEGDIDQLLGEIESMSDTTSDLGTATSDLDQMIAERNSLTELRLTLNEQHTYNTAIAEMLKDTGIKTKIIKQYLPVINKLVNQYLQVLDFFVSFYLDESFSETIKSRFRDEFTYDSFSEGEKQRIDLALLFTWRAVAKMKNSVATNLLILDETFDASLDYDGVDNLMKIIYSLGDDTNVFVISHKGDVLDGRFKSKLEFIKEKNFSKIKGN